MIDDKTAKKQLRRCSVMRIVPDDVSEVARALQKHAKSDCHAADVVTFLLETESFYPTPAAVIQACEKVENTEDAAKKAREECRYCEGSGFRIVQGEHGITGAYPCNHQPKTDRDYRMGVRMAPAVSKRYNEEALSSMTRREEWLRKRAEKHDPGFHRVTKSDIDAIFPPDRIQ